MDKLYKITFDTKMYGDLSWRIDVSAKNLKEAKSKAEQMWGDKYRHSRRTPHMFHVNIKMLKPTEEFLYHWFTKIEL